METLKKNQLFWDVGKINPKKYPKFVIERILEYGDEQDFKWAKDFYGSKKIREVIYKSRNMDKKSFNFWCQFFNLNKEKCILNQSARWRELFWKR